MKPVLALLCAVLLAACQVTTVRTPTTAPAPTQPAGDPLPASRAIQNFETVVRRVAPVAVRTCQEQTRGVNCNFQIVVDRRPDLPPNAFQTLDRSGRPIIGFTRALIEDARNQDEIAFVLSHEAAHHIAGHIPETRELATGGALVGAALAGALGLDPASAQQLQRLGGTIGARSFAKEFELEADALGTVIAARAGYDPVRGAEFFNRIPDPGDRFLGTHPPNTERISTVRRVAAGL